MFFCGVAIIDYCVGKACDYLNAHVKGGDALCHYEVYRKAEADIIVLGSSRADHHYVPSILSDSLGMSCYNCGYDALGILSMYPRFRSVIKRRTPKIVIYDVNPDVDIYGQESSHLKFLGDAKRYCDDKEIMDYIADVEPLERFKLQSRLYRYNTSIFQLLRDYVDGSRVIDRGYRPNTGIMDYTPKPFEPSHEEDFPDSIVVKYMKKLIVDCKERGIRLVLAASPRYEANSISDFREVQKLSKEYGIPFVCHYDDKDFSSRKEFFVDPTHMNDTGAHEYTKKLAHELGRRKAPDE